MTRHLAATARALAALAAIVVMVAGVPAFLVVAVGNPYPPEGLAWDAPATDNAVLGLLAVICWVFWAQMVVCLLAEALGALRRVPVPQVPLAFGGQQQVARMLVHAVLVTTAAGAAASIAPPAAPAAAPAAAAVEAAPGGQPPTTASLSSVTVGGDGAAGAPGRDTHTGASATTGGATGTGRHRMVTAAPGDNLWALAGHHLGDPQRWREIARLNRGRTMADGARFHDADLIRPGWRLLMPADATGLPWADPPPPHPHTYRVRPGDTLSGIAATQLGDGRRWPQLHAANRDQITDPDLIQPGWVLRIPTPTGTPDRAGPGHQRDEAHPSPGPAAHEAAPDGAGSQAQGAPPKATPAAPTERGVASPPPAPTAAEAADDTPRPDMGNEAAEARDTADAGTDEPDEHTQPWLLAGLTGGGVMLSAALYRGLRRRRHHQFRGRRPGRTIAVPDPGAPEVAGVEKTLNTTGAPAVAGVEFVDQVLRRLAAAHAAARAPMPAVAAVELTAQALVLHLHRSAELQAPWQPRPDRVQWMVPVDVDLGRIGPTAPDQPAPYPLLATLGTDDVGGVWLLNGEDLGAVAICGDPTRGRNLARYLAAEVAMNPWSQAVRADCVGIGQEIAGLNPARVRYHDAGDAGAAVAAEVLADAVATLDRATGAGTDAVAGRVGGVGDEVWPARLLLAADHQETPQEKERGTQQDAQQGPLDELVRFVDTHPGRTGTCVVLTGETDTSADTAVLQVTPTGRVRLPHGGPELTAVGLTEEEAAGCAALVAASENLDDVAVPVDDSDTGGWLAYVDEAGALRTEHTQPRATEPDGGDEPTHSLLDGDDEDYLREAATTTEDLQTLAPQVPARVRGEVEAADPSLDGDVTTWFSPDCDLPRLHLLGPVTARTGGDPLAVANRKPYYTELLAYLATRPHGATVAEVAEAFGISPGRVRTDIKAVRDWLGTNPRTGARHLPEANKSGAARTRGINAYQVDGLLVDADLFRRLRARAQARGAAAGIEDLVRALRLVTGKPFDQLRRAGWGWLVDGDRLDHHLVVAICDVAHLVTTHALEAGDLKRARAAAEIATLAAPYEEVPRLDLARVTEAEGYPGEADRILRDDVCNRSDDGEAPTELAERTETIIRSRDWLAAG